jgi:DNA-binding response OmpR family regulator
VPRCRVEFPFLTRSGYASCCPIDQQGMSITALVVHVAASTLHQQSQALQAAGLAVVTASSFKTACELLADVRPDIMIVPVQLGEYNGIHLALRARSVSPHTRVLVTGYPDRVLEHEAMTAGATYLRDPDVRRVQDAVWDTLRHRRGQAHVVARTRRYR